MEGHTPSVTGTLRLECLMLEFDGRRYLAIAILDEEGRHQLLSRGFGAVGFLCWSLTAYARPLLASKSYSCVSYHFLMRG